jgi:uncharacterized repeat protein (TIGR03803 family)
LDGQSPAALCQVGVKEPNDENEMLWMTIERLFTLLMRLLWAAVLVLPVFGAQAAVVFASLHSFTGTNDGAYPNAGLVQATDGNLYGTTEARGRNGAGTIFKISTVGVLTTLYAFGTVTNASGQSLDGTFPEAGLVQGSDGNFYGTTYGGGTNGFGTVFKIGTNGALRTLSTFGTVTNSIGQPLDGVYPYGPLVQSSDGNFYGTTCGSPDIIGLGYGTVFNISTNGVRTTLHSFTGGSDGWYPFAGLVKGSDGYLYGTTKSTIFKVGPNGALTTLHVFTYGGDVYAGLVQGRDGNLYGVASGIEESDNLGRVINYGTVFKISTNGELTTLYSFGSAWDTNSLPLEGANPETALVQGMAGYLYGTTPGGGMSGAGTVFKISTNGVLTSLYSFTGGNDGANPSAALVQASDRSFYGTTEYGGTNDAGTVFRLTVMPDPQLTIIPSAADLILTWSTNATGFTLQSTTNLVSAVWTNLPAPVVLNGQYTVTNSISGTQQFFRLSQ